VRGLRIRLLAAGRSCCPAGTPAAFPGCSSIDTGGGAHIFSVGAPLPRGCLLHRSGLSETACGDHRPLGRSCGAREFDGGGVHINVGGGIERGLDGLDRGRELDVGSGDQLFFFFFFFFFDDDDRACDGRGQ